MPNPGQYVRDMRLCYGNCITVGVLGNRRQVILAGPAANRMVLLDAGENFSSRWGWEVVRAHFPGMVLLRDFADRRLHRRMTAPLFKPEVLRRPMIEKDPVIRESLKSWPEAVDVNCGNKRLTLEVALRVFGGFEGGAVNEPLCRNMATLLDNVLAPPGIRRWRGLRARDRLRRSLHRELARRRQENAEDLFTRLAAWTDEVGRRLSDGDVVDLCWDCFSAPTGRPPPL